MLIRTDERKTLCFALRLAVEWESSLISSMLPTFGEPDVETKVEMSRSRRNMRKFQRLLNKLQGD